ncbi:MAG TPA: hypothetical protein VGO59_18255 [Verrucomicrobiae bacterium]|jgi:hypothetical protein
MFINVMRIDLGAGTSGYAYDVISHQAARVGGAESNAAFPSPQERKALEEEKFQELQQKEKLNSENAESAR